MSDTPNLKNGPRNDHSAGPKDETASQKQGVSGPTDTDPDFVISEAHEQGPEMVGGYRPESKPSDDLGIESTSDLMESEAHRGVSGQEEAHLADDNLIGQSEPPPPPVTEQPSFEPEPRQPDLENPQGRLAHAP